MNPIYHAERLDGSRYATVVDDGEDLITILSRFDKTTSSYEEVRREVCDRHMRKLAVDTADAWVSN